MGPGRRDLEEEGSAARVWFCGAGVGRSPNAVEIGI